MNRKFKALGLALIAVFAMTALSAATASAEQWHAGAHGTVKGINVGEETFTTNAGTVKCKVAEYNGTVASTTVSNQSVKPTYKECTAFGFVNTTIDVGSCEYEFTTPIKTTSTIHIKNCATPIRVTAFNCEVTVGNQNNLAHIQWHQIAGSIPHAIQGTVTASGITYTQHSKSFPGCTNGTFSNGTYTGTNQVKAFTTAGVQTSLTVT
jgi:hypothetical protein